MSGLGEAKHLLHLDETGPPVEEPPAIAVMRRIDKLIARVEEVALSICLATLVLLGVFAAAKRNIHFLDQLGGPAFWIDEIIRYSVFFIGLTGAALAAQSDRLFNIDMFSRLLSARGKLVIRVLTALFTIFVCYQFFKGGLRLRAAIIDEKGELIRPALGILSLPIAMALVSTHLALHSLIDIYYLVSGKTPPDLVDLAKQAKKS